MRYIKAINGTIEAAIVDILFIPPMITRATNKLITIEVIKGSIPKLDSMVLEILSIWGIFPDPKVLIKRDTKKLYYKAKMKIIKNLIGFNSKIRYESSNHKKIIVNTANESIVESANKILNRIW